MQRKRYICYLRCVVELAWECVRLRYLMIDECNQRNNKAYNIGISIVSLCCGCMFDNRGVKPDIPIECCLLSQSNN